MFDSFKSSTLINVKNHLPERASRIANSVKWHACTEHWTVGVELVGYAANRNNTFDVQLFQSAKTKLIWLKSKANLKKIANLDLNLYIGADVIKSVSVVRDLGVFPDGELSMHHHINTVVRSCFFHLRRLKSVRRIVGTEITSGLVSAFVATRLDYLQLSPRAPSTIYDWSTSACSECGCQTCCRNRNVGPHHSSPPELTLASDQVSFCLHALRAHAPGASWSRSCVLVGHDDIRGWPDWAWETEIFQMWTSKV